jgi:alkylation response protein AidB-like acyl-CoA dehydrogenase
MSAGETRGSVSMSEPDLGSDVAAIKTRAAADGDDFVIDGAKMWLTNGGTSNLTAVLVKTDEGVRAHRARQDRQDGLRGGGHHRDGVHGLSVAAGQILGGKGGGGFAQMMDGVEVGRVTVAARACDISIRAFELAVEYAQQRSTFGKPIAEHQAIAFKLAEMATKVEAAHLMMANAARLEDSGERFDVEAGMAELLASEYCAEVTQEAFRIHGGYGYSKEYEIERLMREAPFLLIGEGTSEIQKTIISRACCGSTSCAERRQIGVGVGPTRRSSSLVKVWRSPAPGTAVQVLGLT